MRSGELSHGNVILWCRDESDDEGEDDEEKDGDEPLQQEEGSLFGFLFKSGGKNPGHWQKRWVVLDKFNFMYYRKRGVSDVDCLTARESLTTCFRMPSLLVFFLSRPCTPCKREKISRKRNIHLWW